MEQETLVPEELPPLLVDLLGPYLARQRWCGVEGLPGPVRTIESGCLAELGSPSRRLLWAIVEVQGSDYQVVIAERPIEELAEHLVVRFSILTHVEGCKVEPEGPDETTHAT